MAPQQASLCLVSSFSSLIYRVHNLESAEFTVIGPDQPVTAIVGEDIVLPCHLSPPMSAEDMEVRWFRSHYSLLVHHYRNGKDQIEYQMPEYTGRTEFLKDGIRNGSVALRLHNIRPTDEGRYTCYFESTSFYKDAHLELKLAALGTGPLISVEGYQDGGIRVVCRSAGWYPEPEVFWSTILKQEKESTIYIAELFFPKKSPWIAILCTILVIQGFFIGLLIYLLTTKEKRAAERRWRNCLTEAERVTLDPETANPYLILSKDRKRARLEGTDEKLLANHEGFIYSPCVLASEGFTSGTHYWGVEVGSKGGWAVGVARESVRRKKGVVILNPEEGIWAVERQWWGKFWGLTNPMTRLSLSRKPEKIRVSLDYEGGQVEFFDADNVKPFYTFHSASFADEKIFPFFRVGGAGAHLRLCP
ncbi:unnamed protein product [Caretta caretta]